MYQALLVIYLLVAIALIGFILIQQGKGANAGASFGGGASGTVFGSAGAGNFLSRTTAILATIFFIVSLGGVVFSSHSFSAPKNSMAHLSCSKTLSFMLVPTFLIATAFAFSSFIIPNTISIEIKEDFPLPLPPAKK